MLIEIRRSLRPIRENARQLRHRWPLRLRYYLRPRRYPTVVLFVLAEPRTGSNLLIDYLNQIPGITALEELLNTRAAIGLRRWAVSKRAALRHIAYSINIDSQIVAVKLMLEHLNWHGIEVQDLHRSFPQARYILLYRQDLAAQYASFQTLLLTGQDRFRPDSGFNGTIRIDSQMFRRYCEVERKRYAAAASSHVIAERGVIFSYEDLVADCQTVFDTRVCPLLGVQPVPLKTRLVKQNTRALQHTIANYAELASLLTSPVARHTITGAG